jgi:uncharacterized protein
VKLTRQSPADRQLIQRYGNGGFRISGVAFQGSVIVTPVATLSWPVSRLDNITLEDFHPLIARANAFDVCLLGCGERMQPLPPQIRMALKDAGLTADPMDTGAACRTYNVLMGEGRAVAAALIAI